MKTTLVATLAASLGAALLLGSSPARADIGRAAGDVVRGTGHRIAQTGRATGREAVHLTRRAGHAVAVTGRHVTGRAHHRHRRHHHHHA